MVIYKITNLILTWSTLHYRKDMIDSMTSEKITVDIIGKFVFLRLQQKITISL